MGAKFEHFTKDDFSFRLNLLSVPDEYTFWYFGNNNRRKVTRLNQISIVIPVHNGVSNGLERCLKSITSQNYPYIELILVDDASSDSSLTIIDQFCKHPRCKRVLHNVNQGIAASLNDGISLASGKYIMIIQQDCTLLTNDTISKSLELISNDKNIDILVGRQIYNLYLLNFYQKFSEFSLEHFSLYLSPSRDIDLTENKCDIIKKEALDKIGPFDISQRFSGEDQIFSNRALTLGLKLYLGDDPKYMNQLLGENTLFKVLKKQYRYGKYSWLLYKKLYRHKPIKQNGISYATSKMHNRVMSVGFSFSIVIFLFLLSITLSIELLGVLILILLGRGVLGYIKLVNQKKKFFIPQFSALSVSGMLILSDLAFSLGLLRGIVPIE
jgi:glycosyltransferase involved in cell wall biosynthesis